MKRLRSEREKVIPRLFDLTEDSVEYRNRMRTYANAAVWFVLSFLTMAVFIFLAESMLQRFAIIGLSFIKYLPLIFVVYAIAKTKAATYLADVFELEDESIAYNFIEEVAFGDGSEQITINEGKISERDEQSSIILIGGPGYVQVNLDSVALLERVNGIPEIIHTRPQPWKLGRFERIREIGKYDEVGKREYAIINLRDQFVRGLTVKSRTKDGIPIEAQDIKVMFSILRKPQEDQTDPNPYHFDENAVYSLVYNQIIITPPPKAAGVSFPWDTTVIPLVTGELEDLITSRNLSEILASISVREVDAINQGEASNTQMRLEMTGEQTVTSIPGSSKMPNFESRSKITAQFFSDAFKEKAGKLGVAVHWIDIGTWELPNEIILEELKGAWKMMRDNAARRNAIERSGKRHEMQGFLDLVNSVIIGNYNRSSSGGSSNRKLSEKEYLELMRMVEDNPEIVSNPRLQQRFSNNAASKKDAHTVVIEVLKAFRHELIAARELIQKENRSSIEKQAEISKIEKALRDIDYYVFPTS